MGNRLTYTTVAQGEVVLYPLEQHERHGVARSQQ